MTYIVVVVVVVHFFFFHLYFRSFLMTEVRTKRSIRLALPCFSSMKPLGVLLLPPWMG